MGNGFCADVKSNRFSTFRKDNIANLDDAKTACLEMTDCSSFTWNNYLYKGVQYCYFHASHGVQLDPTQTSIGGTTFAVTDGQYTGVGEAVTVVAANDRDCWQLADVSGMLRKHCSNPYLLNI